MINDACLSLCSNPQIIEKVKSKLKDTEDLFSLAELFKVLGDPTRIKILDALSNSELCVCDIAEIMEMGSSAVSHQLRVLRAAKIVKFRRNGKNVIYSLDDDHVSFLIKTGLEHVQE
ncbi:MAG: metalloregulator ArsR/SmtB family transcription factor [Desulforegulaceae bacterium]|nr:metalloregulator ArsR/SmtB family transcription factor [Desulforegulaceae bacterium]